MCNSTTEQKENKFWVYIKHIRDIAFAILAIIVILFAVLEFYSSIDKKVEKAFSEKIESDIFIKKIADKIGPSYLTFNDNKVFLAAKGTDEYIKDIKIKKDNDGIVITIELILKKYLANLPVLTCISGNHTFTQKVDRGNRFNIVYNLSALMTSAGNKIYKLDGL